MQFDEELDFWRFHAPDLKSTIMVSPSKQEEFEVFLENSGTQFELIINDVETILEEERSNMTRDARSTSISMPNFKIYWSAHEMEQYCSYLAFNYPELVEMEKLAVTPEGRNLYAMKISSGIFGRKPIIAMESGEEFS